MVSYDLDFVGGIKTTNKWIHMDGTQLVLSRQSQLKPVINSIFQQEGLLRRVVPPIQLHPKSHVSDFVEETGGTLQKSLYKIHKGGVATHYKIRAPDPPCLHPFSLFGPRNPVYKIRTFRIVNQKLYKMHLGGATHYKMRADLSGSLFLLLLSKNIRSTKKVNCQWFPLIGIL